MSRGTIQYTTSRFRTGGDGIIPPLITEKSQGLICVQFTSRPDQQTAEYTLTSTRRGDKWQCVALAILLVDSVVARPKNQIVLVRVRAHHLIVLLWFSSRYVSHTNFLSCRFLPDTSVTLPSCLVVFFQIFQSHYLLVLLSFSSTYVSHTTFLSGCRFLPHTSVTLPSCLVVVFFHIRQ